MRNLTYGSVCSGIEAASVAWEPLGFTPNWFAEIEPFPCAVLAERWPGIPNLGDMTVIAERIRAKEISAPDILVGGTPCQSYSIAGLRAGRKDPRGALTFSYLDLANAIDEARREDNKPPAVAVWENVPGVLSDKDNAFGQFLAGLAGEDAEFEPGPRPERGKSSRYWRWNEKTLKHVACWPQRGCVYGPQRKVAWRVLDAQYYGVAQRRKRVFVVASAGDGFDPTEVLFEFEGMRRDIAPSRGTEKATATTIGSSIETFGSHWDHPLNPHPTLNQSHNTGGIGASNQEIFSQHGSGIVGTIAAHSFTGGAGGRPDGAAAGHFIPVIERSAISIAGNTIGRMPRNGGNGTGFNEEMGYTLTKTDQHGVAIGMHVRRLTPRECERLQGFPDDHTLIPYGRAIRPEKMDRDYAKYLMRGGKLTFEECCQLAADGPRYKAIGNSMAVPVMRWIGKRVQDAIVSSGILQALPLQQPVSGLVRVPKSDEELSRPFLKWPGGKFSAFRAIERYFPSTGRLIEPFAGAGSIFLNAGFSSNFIADRNSDLINTYQALKEHAHALITLTQRFFNDYGTEEGYRMVKKNFNMMHYTRLERAAAFIFINKHCFNGLVRYNLKGEFNVGWGSPKKAYFPFAEMEHFLSIADSCTFQCGSFETTISQAGAGDVIFCDPPYEPLPGKDGFTHYSGGSFSFDKQELLVGYLKAAHQRGATAIITNSGAPIIYELYRDNGFTVNEFDNQRKISCKGNTRKRANDIIAVL